MTCIIYILLLIVVAITSVKTKSCDILENMSCECHSSLNGEVEQLTCNNHKKPLDTKIKLTSTTVQTERSFDSFHLTFYDKEVNVSSMFINELSRLFPRSSSLNKRRQKSTIKITLSFHNFVQLHFQEHTFYQLFTEKSDYTTILTLELTSNGQITFSPNAFGQLIVDQMFLHSSSLEPYTFEEVFNNTNIGELTIEGFTPRSENTYKTRFNGKIRLAKFTKMVELVSSEEFPNYPVRSMIIEAHEARRLNASTFVSYRNLHGLHLVRPKFFFDNRSFDGFQYLANLESIELDAETLKDHTFQNAARIRFFTLGQNSRFLSEHSLDHLDSLTRFDASNVVLDQLYPLSRCVLARYIHKQKKNNPAIIILPPQAEYCDCIYDFILAILYKKPDNSYVQLCSDNQQERCQLSECDIVKSFRLPLMDNTNNQQIIPSIVDTPISSYPIDDGITATHRLPSYVHRHPSANHNSDNQIGLSDKDTQHSHVSALKAPTSIDPNAIPTDDYDENLDPTVTIKNSETLTKTKDEERRIAMKNETLKWMSISLVCITILCLLLVGTLIWFFTCRPSKRYNKAGFQPVQPHSSKV